MIFPGIAIYAGGAGIGPGPVGTHHLPVEGIFQVYQLLFIKFYVSHFSLFRSFFDLLRIFVQKYENCKSGTPKLHC
jgi:hypothetical protein